jgi:hypothetical protein
MVPFMRGRIVKIGVVLCALGGAVYAADQAAAPAQPTVEQTIAQQLVGEGQEAHESGLTKDIEHFSPDQMLGLAVKYDQEMRQGIEHGENVKVQAYRSHDLIRMSCIGDKIEQMKSVMNLVEARYLMLRSFKTQAIVMQSQFAIISLAHDRVTQLVAEVDGCMGDNLEAVSAGRIHEEILPNTNDPNDPTRPGTPLTPIDRPPEASPYR